MEKKKVSKELVQPWLDALRSGQYKQGKYKLRTEEGNYCCIGVWAVIHNCSISDSGMDDGSVSENTSSYDQIEKIFGNSSLFFTMNDTQDRTFEEIANFVEENYELV